MEVATVARLVKLEAMMVWGTFILDAYRQSEARELTDALEALFAPNSGTTWSSGGVYLFWDFESREVLYVGLASDFPVRFAQHNGIRGCPAKSCKKEQLAEHFDRHELVGYTVLPLSSLTQPETKRMQEMPGYDRRDLEELRDWLNEEAMGPIRDLEGALIEANRVRFGERPPWNDDPGRIPKVDIPEMTRRLRRP